MPHGALVTDHERQQIKTLHESGLSIRGIAAQLKRSSSLVRHALQRGLDQPAKLTGGRKRKLGEDGDQAILDFVAENGNSISCAQIKSILNLDVSERTIQRILRRREHGQLPNAPAKQKPPLKYEHKHQRLEWIALYKAWTTEWDSVLFIGGRRFTLTGPDQECSWIGLGAEKDIRTAVHDNNAPGFSVWLTFSSTVKGEIVVLQNDMNSPAFKQFCDQTLVPTALTLKQEATENDGSILYHNDTPIPRSQNILEELEVLHIRPMLWPPRSPDLNPLEYVFAGLARMVYSLPIDDSIAAESSSNHMQQVTFSSLEELKEAIQASWASIAVTDLAQEVMTININMQEIEKNGGGHMVKDEGSSKKQQLHVDE